MAVVAAVMTLTLSACGGGESDESAPEDQKNTAQSKEAGEARATEVNTEEVIAELQGAGGVELAVHSAVRDTEGFVTIHATATNNGDGSFAAAEWRSQETEMKSKSSISGASIVDKEGKKRYMVLRDTDGQCLCTTGIRIASGDSTPIFAQFPAPPEDVTQVEFNVPSMSPADLELTEG
ncbi:hypothetical protein WDH52_16675 [Streptomyces sp. TRM70308]|uniref:hypothetical protein n=1 Tax=Streptomyces sp. TRM70308 TaxID=3131932 RepID=UPI003D01880E